MSLSLVALKLVKDMCCSGDGFAWYFYMIMLFRRTSRPLAFLFRKEVGGFQ